MGTERILVLGGVLAILAGAVGGGVSLAGGSVPLLSTRARQGFVFAVGVALLGLGLFLDLRRPGAGATRQESVEVPATNNVQGGVGDDSRNSEMELLAIRVRIRARLFELSSRGNTGALVQMCTSLGLTPNNGATAGDLRRLIQSEMDRVDSLAGTRELASRLGVPPDQERPAS